MKTENLTKYTCDACGADEYVVDKESAKIREYKLPVRCFGARLSTVPELVTKTIHLCPDCSWRLDEAISTRFKVCYIAGYGLQMERRKTDE